MQQLEAQLTDLNQLQRGHLRLGIPPIVGHVYARLFRQYRQTYPNVELTVVEYGGRKIEQAILDGDIDVAVTMLSLISIPILLRLPSITTLFCRGPRYSSLAITHHTHLGADQPRAFLSVYPRIYSK